MSLRNFKNCNILIINHFRNYGVEDELEAHFLVEDRLSADEPESDTHSHSHKQFVFYYVA